VSGREGARSCGALLSASLRRVGHDTNDVDNRENAMEALRDAIQEFNSERVWIDRLLPNNTITLVASQATYALPSRYQKSFGRAFLRNTSSERTLVVQVISYQRFLRRVSDESAGESTPRILTVANRVDLDVAEIWPIPSTSDVTTYPTIEFPYYADIPVCENDNDNLAVSGAVEQAILAKAVSILNDDIGDAKKADRFDRRASMMLSKAIAYDNRLRIENSNLRGGRFFR